MALTKNTAVYYRGTQAECDAYNALVTQGEKYHDTTTAWADTYCIDDVCYILKHPDYETNLEIVTTIPKIE